MTIITDNQQPATSEEGSGKEFFFILTGAEHEEHICQFSERAHLKVLGRAVITDSQFFEEIRGDVNLVNHEHFCVLEDFPTQDTSLPALGIVLSFAVDDTHGSHERLGHILSDPMVRIKLTELAKCQSILQLWYQFNPVGLSGRSEGRQIEPEQTGELKQREEDEDAWKQRVIAHDIAVLQARGWEVVGPQTPVAPAKPHSGRMPRPPLTGSVTETITYLKQHLYQGVVAYLNLLESMHQGQYEYLDAEDQHVFNGIPHEGCFNCLSTYTAGNYLLSVLDEMGTLAVKLFDVPGREDDLVEAIVFFAWALHRIDRQPAKKAPDTYVRRGQQEVLDYAAATVEDLYRRSRAYWVLTPEQEATEMPAELMDRLVTAFARTYMEETSTYLEWGETCLRDHGKLPFWRF